MPYQALDKHNAEMGTIVQATATNMTRFTARQDYMSTIGDYLNRSSPFWSVITKEQAEADLVKEILYTGFPQTGFSDKNALNAGVTQQPAGVAGNRSDLSDPGQYVKALTGEINWSHYERSLYDSQGKPFGDQVAKDTDDMIVSACQDLSMALTAGDATTNPLEFNGIVKQIAPNHEFVHDARVPGADLVGRKLAQSVLKATTSRRKNRKIDAIRTTARGWDIIQGEIEGRRLYVQDVEVVPGLTVPGIRTKTGMVPILVDEFLNDENGATANDPDIVDYWLLDMSMIAWKGVYPWGGAQTFDPQVFDITSYVGGVPLTQKRMLIHYGTLYAKDRGDGIWRQRVKVPRDTGWHALD